MAEKHTLELETEELQYIRQHVAAQYLTYARHAAGAGLFPKEKQRMEWLRALLDKLEAAAAAPEMLEALKASNDKLRELLFDGDEHPLIAANNAVIAAATGEAP